MTEIYFPLFLAILRRRAQFVFVNRHHQPNDTMKTLTAPAKRTASDAYLAAYTVAMAALKNVENFIHDNPAPDSETKIDWGHVGDMNRIAEMLNEIIPD